MSSETILRPYEINTDLITFSDIKKGYKREIAIYHNNEKLYFQLTRNRTPFGVSSFNGNSKKHVDVSIDEPEIVDKFREIDDFILDTAYDKSEEWFGEKKTKEQLKQMFYRSLKQSKNYSPTFRQKFNKNKSGDYTVYLFDEHKNQIDLSKEDIEDYIKKFDYITSIVCLDKVWIMKTDSGDKFGIEYNSFQIIKSSSKFSISTPSDSSDSSDHSSDPPINNKLQSFVIFD